MYEGAIAIRVMGLIIWRLGIPCLLALAVISVYLHFNPGIVRRFLRG